MSSSDRRALRRLALAFGLSLLAGGCFRPVYGDVSTTTAPTKNEGADVAARMKLVDVKPIDNRVGNRLRNELIFMLRGGDGPAQTFYTLKVTSLQEFKQTAILNPLTDVPQTRSISYTADYQLLRSGSLDPVMTGRNVSTATLFSGLQRFANIRAERDAEDRIATQLAEQMRSRLLAYFSTGK